jgi:hypothetical protein
MSDEKTPALLQFLRAKFAPPRPANDNFKFLPEDKWLS